VSKSYDLIVIGAGTSGMACATEAAKRGLSVCVIEKSDKIGGSLYWSGGHMSAGGTQLQKRLGIEDSPQEHYRDILRITKGTGDQDLIQLAVEEAPRTIDWLDENGFEFAPEAPRIIYGHIPYTKARTHYGIDKAMSIFKVMKTLWDEQSENIDLFLQHPIMGINQKNDRWSSVVCSSFEGQLVFYADHIVFATGGYGSNIEYFNMKHKDTPLMSSTFPTSTGDGHMLLEKLNGVFRMADLHIPSIGGIELDVGSGVCDFNNAWAMVLTSVYRRPRDIYVNSSGNRFMNEDEANPDIRERAVMKQEGWKFWIIFDESALMERDEQGNENPIVIGWDTARIKKEAENQKAIFSSETIDGLAQMTKLPLEQLQKTIDQYNTCVENKKDPVFKREYLENKIEEGPYYAILVYASVLVTFGGMQVNKDLKVINQDGDVENGLYAAGEILGLGATSGNAFCSGMAITPALSFGRVLGKNLGK